MAFKIVLLFALMIVSTLSLPRIYEPPHQVALAENHKGPMCPCAKIYLPLCASDGVSYNNMCEFNCQARHVRQLFGTDMFVVKEDRCEGTE